MTSVVTIKSHTFTGVALGTYFFTITGRNANGTLGPASALAHANAGPLTVTQVTDKLTVGLNRGILDMPLHTMCRETSSSLLLASS